MERRTTSAQLLTLRDRLERALLQEAARDPSSARERILEQRFFESPETPAPTHVVDLSARLRPRF